jgi:hypothetical protein
LYLILLALGAGFGTHSLHDNADSPVALTIGEPYSNPRLQSGVIIFAQVAILKDAGSMYSQSGSYALAK